MAIDCDALYDQVYDDAVAAGYTAAQAGDKASLAYQECVRRNSSTVATQTVNVPGGRQYDRGPTSRGLNTKLGKPRHR